MPTKQPPNSQPGRHTDGCGDTGKQITEHDESLRFVERLRKVLAKFASV